MNTSNSTLNSNTTTSAFCTHGACKLQFLYWSCYNDRQCLLCGRHWLVVFSVHKRRTWCVWQCEWRQPSPCLQIDNKLKRPADPSAEADSEVLPIDAAPRSRIHWTQNIHILVSLMKLFSFIYCSGTQQTRLVALSGGSWPPVRSHKQSQEILVYNSN
jgi:hypothetical protein